MTNPGRWSPSVPPSPTSPRLWRSPDEKVVAGVCGGLAERFQLDPMFVRVLYVALSLFSGAFPGFLIYLVLWYVAPVRGETE
jgi:phage shock protein C